MMCVTVNRDLRGFDLGTINPPFYLDDYLNFFVSFVALKEENTCSDDDCTNEHDHVNPHTTSVW